MAVRTILLILFFVALSISFDLSRCLAQADANNSVEISTVWSLDAGKPGQQVVLAVVLDVAEGYTIGNAKELIPAANQA